jgi:hypothetical protein
MENINIQIEAQNIHAKYGQSELANYKIQLLFDRYATLKMIKENESILEMAKSHMDERAVFVLNDRIAYLKSTL